MKKRILLLATVATLMAVMLVAMASAALAVPPGSGTTGCFGGKSNAEHAIGSGYPARVAQDNIDNPAKAEDAPGTQDNPGHDKATDNTGASCPHRQ
jgi:hypothetical protein